MQNLYRRIQNHIRSLDFDALWPGFHPFPFALYDGQKVVMGDRLLPWDQRFLGNTAIEWEGSPLAIWRINSLESMDEMVLTSKLVHEMFHAFQRASGETRWADEIRQGLRYPYDPDNLCLKFMEDFHLCGFLTSFSEATWKILMSVRNGRAGLFPNEVDYEARIETIEGMAEFIEFKALRAMDEGKYQMALKKIVDILNDPKRLFPIRSACYHSGAVMCLLAERNGLAFHHEIGKENRPLYRLLTDGIPAQKRQVKIQSVITENERFLNQRAQTMENCLNASQLVREGCFPVVGLDPMNSFLLEDRLHFRDFLLYQDQEGTQTVMGEGVGEIDSDFHLYRLFLKKE